MRPRLQRLLEHVRSARLIIAGCWLISVSFLAWWAYNLISGDRYE